MIIVIGVSGIRELAMKRIVSTLLAGIGAVGALAFAASYAEARPPHRHHHSRVGVYIGASLVVSPFYYYPRPYYYYDPYYPYYRQIIVQEQPVVYMEQAPSVAPVAPPPAAAPQAQQQYWYFCQDTQTYYPHVQTCATPWQRVIPHAPR